MAEVYTWNRYEITLVIAAISAKSILLNSGRPLIVLNLSLCHSGPDLRQARK